MDDEQAGCQSTHSQVFLQALTTEVNKQDVITMVESQNHMLSRFEKTNEMLLNFNQLSAGRYESTCEEFRKNTALLTDMKRDLDIIFRRIRTLKNKLSKQYPNAFQACSDVSTVLETELAEVEEENADTSERAATPLESGDSDTQSQTLSPESLQPQTSRESLESSTETVK